MRSGRPGPVLIDLPFDVQMAEIEFDEETYAPLPVYKPRATRAQAEKALAMLNEAERPLIVAGGGIINADAADLLVRVRRDHRRAGDPDADGLGRDPRRPSADGRHGRPADRRTATATRRCSPSDFVLGIGNRWANRHTGSRRGLHARAASSCMSTSSRRRSAACSTRTTASSRTRRPRSNCSSRLAAEWQRSGRLADRSAWARGVPRAQAHDAAPHPFRRRADQAAARL